MKTALRTSSGDFSRAAGDAEVSYGFWIGRYPVTQAQFRAFVEAGGYQDGRYWPEAREAGLWADGVLTVRETKISGPRAFGEPFGFANHPVVGVSWFEARAFCRWLTERLRDVLGEEWAVDLPNELEWARRAPSGVFQAEGRLTGARR